VYPKSVPSFHDNGFVGSKKEKCMYTFAHFVYPKSVPSFHDNGFVGSKKEKCMYTFAHFVYPKSVPSFRQLRTERMRSYYTVQNVHFAHFVYPKSVPSFEDNGFAALKVR